MIYGVDYIAHSARYKARKNHKYIERYWKNGRWNYVYRPKKGVSFNLTEAQDNGKTPYNVAQDYIKECEDRYNNALKELDKTNNVITKTSQKQQINMRVERLKADLENAKKAAEGLADETNNSSYYRFVDEHKKDPIESRWKDFKIKLNF